MASRFLTPEELEELARSDELADPRALQGEAQAAAPVRSGLVPDDVLADWATPSAPERPEPAYDAGGRVYVENKYGRLGTIDPGAAGELAEGMRLAPRERVERELLREENESALGMLQTAGEQGLQGLTLGGYGAIAEAASPEYRQRMEARAEDNPGTALASGILGAAAPALITGGTSALARGGAAVLGATPAGLAARAALGVQEATAARLGGGLMGRIGATALGGATEGAIAGAAARVADSVPEFSTDPIEAAEHILAGAGEGALLGFGAGALLHGAGALAGAGTRGTGRLLGDVAPSAENLRQWAGESAYKAVVGRTNKTSQKFAARHGGDAAVGQTLLDEGIPLASSPEEILAVTSRRADEIGAELGAKAREIDQLGGVPISGREVMQRIDQEVLEPLRGNVFADDIANAVEGKLARFREIMAGRDPDAVVLRSSTPKLGGFADDVAEEAVPASGLMGAARDPTELPRSGLMGDVSPATGPQLKPTRSAGGRVDSGLMGGAPDRNLSFEDVRRMRMDLDKTLAKWEQAGPPSPTTQALRDVRTELEHAWLDAAERSANSVGVEGYADQIRGLKTRYAHMRLAADQAEEALLTRKANRFISLSDNIWGAGALGGAALGDPAGIAAGMATSLAHKYVRERGRGLAALALNQMATLAERKTAMVGLAASGQEQVARAAQSLGLALRRGTYGAEGAAISKWTEQDLMGAIAEARELQDPNSEVSAHLVHTAQQLDQVNPGMGTAYAQAAQARGKMITDLLPKPPSTAIYSPPPAVDPVTDRKIRRTVEASMRPQKTLERIATGRYSPEDKTAMETLYPAMWKRFQGSVQAELRRLKRPPPLETRLRIAIATGLATDPTMESDALQMLQQIATMPSQAVQAEAKEQKAEGQQEVAGAFRTFDADEHFAGPVDARMDRR